MGDGLAKLASGAGGLGRYRAARDRGVEQEDDQGADDGEQGAARRGAPKTNVGTIMALEASG